MPRGAVLTSVSGRSGRSPAPLAIEAGHGRQRQGARHVSILNAAIVVTGIDIGRNPFHVAGLDQRLAIVLRHK